MTTTFCRCPGVGSRLEEIAGRPDQGRSRHKPHAISPQDRADSRNDLSLPFAL
jgi:hypothetical protein